MSTSVDPNNILVRAQDTPNPMALRFVVNYDLKQDGNATFVGKEQAEGLPLIESLFDVPGIKQIYLFENTMTVTHQGLLDNELVKEHVESVIRTRLPIHNPNFSAPEELSQRTPKNRDDLSPEMRQVEEILDRTIRPGLQADGGDLEVISYDEDELRVLYMGACGGCPSAMMGTLDAIQNILRHELDKPELIVIPI